MNTGASDLRLDQVKAALRPAGSFGRTAGGAEGPPGCHRAVPAALTGLIVDEVLVGWNGDRLWLMLQHAIGRLQEHYASQATLYFLGGVLIFAE